VNGLGDLYLTVSGTLQIQEARTISGRVERDAVTGDATCYSELKPTVSWTKDPANTMAWSSGYDIEFVTIPQFERTNRNILAQYRVMDKAGLVTLVNAGKAPNEALKVYNDNEVAQAGWRGLLEYNQLLKDNSEPWPEFYQVRKKRERMENNRQMGGRNAERTVVHARHCVVCLFLRPSVCVCAAHECRSGCWW
jgi:hypothetical protein